MKQIYFFDTIPKAYRLVQVDKLKIFTIGCDNRAKYPWIKVIYFCLALIHGVNPLAMISMAVLIGLLNLGSTLASTPCVKWAQGCLPIFYLCVQTNIKF